MWTEQSRTLLVNRPDGPFVGYRCPDQVIDVFHRLDLRFDNAHLTFTIPLQGAILKRPQIIYNTVVLERYASGFHVCGYGTTGIPEFWFISNILEMDDFVYTRMALRYSPPSPDFLDRDAKALGWNGHDSGSIKNGVQFYRNGDYRLHAAAWHRLDAVFQEVVNFSGSQ